MSAGCYLNRTSAFGAYSSNGGATNLDNLLIALNQETAGQYALAVVSYQTALKTPDTNIPAKLIGDKLDAIKKGHPKEYEDGMQMVTNPPSPRYYPGYPLGINPALLNRPAMPGYPVQQSSVLAIPASTNQLAPVAPTPVSSLPQTNAAPVK